MDADHVLADPAGCGVLAGWPLLGWEGRLLGLARLSEAIRPGGIPQPPAGHDHPPGPAPLGVRELEGGGHNAWLCQAPPAAFHRRRAWIPRQQGLGGPRCASRSVVARMTPRCGAMRASGAARDARRAPVLWDTTGTGARSSPGRPRLLERDRGAMGPAGQEAACPPGAKVVRACWASAAQAQAVRQRGGTAWAAASRGLSQGWPTLRGAWGRPWAAEHRLPRGATPPLVEARP